MTHKQISKLGGLARSEKKRLASFENMQKARDALAMKRRERAKKKEKRESKHGSKLIQKG